MIRTFRKVSPGDALTGRDVAVYTADSWADWLDYLDNTPAQKGCAALSSRQSGFGGWCPHSWDESIKLARSGWYDIEPRIRAMAESISRLDAGSLGERVAFTMACAGEEYDIGALSEGRPECMYLPTSEITKGRKIYRIGVFPGANGGLNSGAMIRQGAMTCALVAALEARGQTCEIDLSSRCGGGSTGERGKNVAIQIDVPLMSAGDSIDLPFLAFAVAHPAVYRRLTFATMETDIEHAAMGVGGGYGYVQNLNGFPTNTAFDVCVPMAETVAYWNDSKCATWLHETLEGLDKAKG